MLITPLLAGASLQCRGLWVPLSAAQHALSSVLQAAGIINSADICTDESRSSCGMHAQASQTFLSPPLAHGASNVACNHHL